MLVVLNNNLKLCVKFQNTQKYAITGTGTDKSKRCNDTCFFDVLRQRPHLKLVHDDGEDKWILFWK